VERKRTSTKLKGLAVLKEGNYQDNHTQNFIEAVRKNDPALAKCQPSSGSLAAINGHMGNIAYKTGQKIYWDNDGKAFKNNEEATNMIKVSYHNGWKLPSV